MRSTRTSAAPTTSLASFNCDWDGNSLCLPSDIAPVGSIIGGNGFWGHSDLAGNMTEWVFDRWATPYSTPCTDCANATTGTERVERGGSFQDTATYLQGADRGQNTPTNHPQFVGLRCARSGH